MLADRVLAALQGSHAQDPLRLSQIVLRIDPDRPPLESEVVAALDDLVARRAVNTARVGHDARTLTHVYWPTGARPAPLSRRDFVISSFTVLDAERAHKAHRATQQESAMPRIVKPAQPAQPAQPMKAATYGAVRAEVFAALEGVDAEHALTVTELHPLCPTAKSKDSLATCLRQAAQAGKIATRQEVRGRPARATALYWMDESCAGAASPPRTEPADRPEDGPPTAEPVPASEPGWNEVVEDEGTAPEPYWPSIARPPVPRDVGSLTGLDFSHDDAPPRFLLGDDGELEIWQGCDLVVRLAQVDTMRLDLFLERAQPVLWGEA